MYGTFKIADTFYNITSILLKIIRHFIFTIPYDGTILFHNITRTLLKSTNMYGGTILFKTIMPPHT